jgi:3',5'-cyclic AMP phosphodiesterase CpdA
MRIAHFSDLHLLSLEGSGVLDFLNKRWIGALNLVVSRGRHHQPPLFEAMIEDINSRGDIDHIICTGDVTNLALEGEFVYAREFFDRFACGPAGVTVLPGNHDAYVAKGAKYFLGYFSDYYGSDEEFEWEDGDPWPLVRVRGDAVIIGLSTSLATPWFTAYGRIGTKQAERLEQVLGDERFADKLRVVAIHHSPTGERSKSRIRGLRDRDRFAEIIGRTGAELIVHGHEHIDMTEHMTGPDGRTIPVRGIQSGTYEAGKPRLRARYRVYEVGEAASRPALAGERQWVWEPDTGSFVEEDQALSKAA